MTARTEAEGVGMSVAEAIEVLTKGANLAMFDARIKAQHEAIATLQARLNAADELREAAGRVIARRHTHVAEDGDPDTCADCGKNFRNTDVHFRMNERPGDDMRSLQAALATYDKAGGQ